MSVSLRIWLVFDVMWWECTKNASFYVCDPQRETARTPEETIATLEAWLKQVIAVENEDAGYVADPPDRDWDLAA